MDLRCVVGANVRILRLRANLSQEALAVRMGVDRAYVSGLEMGRRNPTVITLWHTAEALGVRAAALLDEGAAATESELPRKRAPKK